MNKIIKKRRLAVNVVELVIDAKQVAKNAAAGQFIILRVDEGGERVPFTVCDFDANKGTVTILVQEVGFSTKKLGQLNEGDFIQDFVGPLGNATDLSEHKRIVLVGGGIGTAVIFPQAKLLYKNGNPCDVIVGARNKDLIMYEDEFRSVCKNVFLTTDDGSYIRKGFVTEVLKEQLEKKAYDCVFAVGPMPMMRAVSNLTKEYGVHTVVSMNTIMIDGTGMCGGCRLTVGGETKYACVHGPEFDGHLIDWDEAMLRSGAYRTFESQKNEHYCNLLKEKR